MANVTNINNLSDCQIQYLAKCSRNLYNVLNAAEAQHGFTRPVQICQDPQVRSALQTLREAVEGTCSLQEQVEELEARRATGSLMGLWQGNRNLMGLWQGNRNLMEDLAEGLV